MKKKVLACLCAMAMLVTMMTGCGAAEEAAVTEVGERTTFTVGFDAEFPPYGYRDENGEYVGFDLDLAAEVCERQGWELVKQPINWDAKDMELSAISHRFFSFAGSYNRRICTSAQKCYKQKECKKGHKSVF